MKDIITIGAATRDVFLESQAFQIIQSAEFQTGLGECVALGSKNEVTEITFETGGGATNAATTFGRLGFKVGVMTSVGNDTNGEEIKKILKKEKVDTGAVQKQKEVMTAYSTLLLWSGGQRSILVYRGASDRLDISKIKLAAWKTKWAYLTSLGGGADQLSLLTQRIKKNNISLFWNPGGAELKLGRESLAPVLALTKILSLNREEAATLLGLSFEAKDEILQEAKNLAPIVLVTDGEAGAYVCQKNKIYFVATLGTKAKNPTGAGDAFGSGFLAGWLKYGDLGSAARLAVLNSDGVIRHTGAKKGLLKVWPEKQELEKVKVTSPSF